MTATLAEQIATLDETAIDYALAIADTKWTDEQMRQYWLEMGQTWMMVIGLRKAQLLSARRYDGLVLVA